MNLHVRDVMTPGVVTIVEDATIRDAGAAMAQGVVTDLDLVAAECGRQA